MLNPPETSEGKFLPLGGTHKTTTQESRNRVMHMHAACLALGVTALHSLTGQENGHSPRPSVQNTGQHTGYKKIETTGMRGCEPSLPCA